MGDFTLTNQGARWHHEELPDGGRHSWLCVPITYAVETEYNALVRVDKLLEVLDAAVSVSKAFPVGPRGYEVHFQRLRDAIERAKDG